MSQNRQEEKDRRRAENDYKVNLKTEIMIEDLYDKVNAILAKQSALEKRLQNDGKNHTKQQENNWILAFLRQNGISRKENGVRFHLPVLIFVSLW